MPIIKRDGTVIKEVETKEGEEELYVVDLLILKENREIFERVKKVCEDISKKDETFEYKISMESDKTKFLVIKVFGNENFNQAKKRGKWFNYKVDGKILYKVHKVVYGDDYGGKTK